MTAEHVDDECDLTIRGRHVPVVLSSRDRGELVVCDGCGVTLTMSTEEYLR